MASETVTKNDLKAILDEVLPASAIPNTIKIQSMATGSGNSEGFNIHCSTSNTTATVLYSDNKGRVAHIHRTAAGGFVITMISGTFAASSADSTDVWLRAEAYTRALFVIASGSPQNLSLSVYGA